MIGPERIFETLGAVLSERAQYADELIARLDAREESFVRFGCNTVLQAMRVRVPKVTVRAVVNGRAAESSTTSLEPSALRAARDRALALAGGRAQPVSSAQEFLSAEGVSSAGRPAAPSGDVVLERAQCWDDATAHLPPSAVAERLGAAFRQAAEAQVELAGRYVTGYVERAVVSAAGMRRYTRSTRADSRVFATDGPLSGYAGSLGTHAATLPLEDHAARAVEKCVRSRRPQALAAGAYDVILEPDAVAEVLEWMGSIGFTPRSVEDGTSFVTGRQGQPVTGPKVTLLDDGWTDGGQGLFNPFDAEGVLRQRVVLLEDGVARDLVQDSASGLRMGCASTGHAVAADEAPGGSAVPANLFMAGGSDSAQGLLERVEDGLWVTSFHYVNGLLEPRRAVMTGLTRHGTFRIQNGRLGAGVHNLRFTDSMLEAFARLDGITAERSAVPTWWSSLGASVAPTVLIRGLQFTGTTQESP